MNGFQQVLASILNPGGQMSAGGNPFLAGVTGVQPGNALSSMSAPQAVAPTPVAAPEQAPAPMSQAEIAPQQPHGASGGVGGFLGNLFGGREAAARNQTVGWLQQQGLDQGTATLLAGNKSALQRYLLDRSKGTTPEYGFMNIDGNLVRTDKTTGSITPMGQFGVQDEVKPMTPTERVRWGIPQSDERPYAMTADGPKLIGGSGVTINTGDQQTAGWKKIDEKFAEDYLKWQGGGFADTGKQLEQLNEALGILESGEDVTGVIGALPDFVQPFVNERGTIAKEAVEEVVQRNLREILGAQFTAQEGERLISRAFNPLLPPEENARRARRIIAQISSMANAKQSMVDYFDKNGTLRGYTGPRPSKGDIEALEKEFSQAGGAGNSAPKQIGSEREYLDLPSGAEFIAPDGTVRRKP